ncbi:MAG: hypothetical protein CMF48_02145 [Legionellales bacterium]|nr:hypothetical protein [Legionellales bacterium]
MINDSLKKISNRISANCPIVVHVRLSGVLKDTDCYSKQASCLLDMLRTNFKPSSIIVPTFTYSFTKTGKFEVLNTPSEVGRFSYEIQKMFVSDKRRTTDPIFSIVETEGSGLVSDRVALSAFDKMSVWHALDSTEHYIININLDLPIIATQLHYLEYIHSVPYRYSKEFIGTVSNWESVESDIKYNYYVRNLDANPQWNRNKIYNDSIKANAIIEDGLVRLFKWSELKTIIASKIQSDSRYLITS